MATIDVLDSHGSSTAIEKPLAPGRAAATASRPVALSNEDKAAVDALATQVTAAAILAKLSSDPATQAKQDAAIAQETAMAGVLGVAADAASATTTIKAALRGIATALGVTALDLGTGTGGTRTLRFFQDTAQWIGGAGAVGTAVQRTTLASDDPAVAVLGTTAGAAVTTSVAGTIQGYLRGIVSLLVSGITVTTHAVTGSGNFASTVADGANVVEGAVVDAVVAAGAAGSLSAKLRAISRDIVANIVLAAGTNLIGKVGLDQTTPGTTNAVAVTSPLGTRVETTVAAGGTAANLFSATPTNGFEIINTHATEWLYIRENGTATVADNSTSTPIAPRGSYNTPLGYKPTGDVSYIAATTGHAVIGRRW